MSLAGDHQHAHLDTYGAPSLPHLPVAWPGGDYDTIWTVTLDAQGNLTVDDALQEGIDSASLPATAPLFQDAGRGRNTGPTPGP